MKVLVTGGLGFIGAHLVNALVKQNHEVTVIDNLYHNQNPETFPFIEKIKFIDGDIRNFELVNQACKNIDVIFHLAALSSIKDSTENPEYCISTNVNGTFNVLKSAFQNKVKKLIFSSSREVYGNAKSLPVKENTPLNPVNIYGTSKVCGESLCNIFAKNYGINLTIFRLSNVYGPNDPGKYRVIPSFIRKIKNNEDLVINGGEQVLDFVWIDDVIKVLLDSIEKYDNEIFNIGGGKGTSIKQLAELVLSVSKSNVSIKYSPPISQEVEKFIADISKIGIIPLELEEGLKKLIL
ncbi:MAG: SDR family NAD(P)-dependent oxidoreductase [Candidatus Nanoarchaeia archaeon]|nr:SDR family NAD(P)-dependent oxidoreductase [Candidatus Nanoarchaeia archaeon]MDD5358153.1 SDR family NAD(P)-dependent oxidoreductase [Candidatus Nanoarchaeia archaeon]MDD5589340.1 SDR family NAD(P)-dependent oxidoreductase [Candidatus Nanoarchaeia archaeon]